MKYFNGSVCLVASLHYLKHTIAHYFAYHAGTIRVKNFVILSVYAHRVVESGLVHHKL